MDYIKKYFTFKGIVSTTAVAVATCAVISLAVISNEVSDSQSASSITEESSSDDGSAPGHNLTVSDINTTLTQSATIAFKFNQENETESNETFLTEKSEEVTTEVVTNVTVTQKETEQPSASAQGKESHQVADSEYVVNFSDEDYQVLCTIVEAEAGDQDAKGRILVANVIINRVKSGSFPNTIKEVVFQNNGKTYQFSPTMKGGRYYRVTPSQLTIECVNRALKGEDYSEGAIYFCMKTSSDSWFNRCLIFLFKHGDHYFYK